MITQTIRGSTLRDAMRLTREQLGEGAIVLDTREVQGDSNDGESHFEVTAAAEEPDDSAADRWAEAEEEEEAGQAPNDGDEASDASVESLWQAVVALRDQGTTATRQGAHIEEALGRIQEELREVVRELGRWRHITPEADPEARGLIANGVEPAIAAALLERARARTAPRRGLAVARPPDLASELVASLRVVPPLWAREGRMVAALTGPTGAGKTRTIVKLAAMSSFVHNRRVGIISTDVHRIGGYESLRAYCEVLRIPVRKARNPKALHHALQVYATRDLVLVDTPGCSPWNAEAIDALDESLDVSGLERHLVLPATMSAEDARVTARRFGSGGLASVMVTKVDEARGPGAVLSAPWGTGMALSHVCNGQTVPEACSAADADRIGREILGHAP